MKTSVEKLEGNFVKLTVSHDAAEVDEAIDKMYKEYSTRIKVPGFRPGKAPKPVVDSYVGQEAIYSEATESLVSDSYPQAVDSEGLRPIESPKVENLDPVKPGEDYEWTAEVQVRPELELSSYDDISITAPSDEVTDADIEGQIEQLRARYASLGPVEDRGVEGNDFALISFESFVDGEEYEGSRVDKYLYQMGMGSMPIEFDEQLTGTMPGETAHIEFTIPESSSVADFVGKTATFEVTVHEIKTQNLPEIDDEFAMQVGGFDSLEELKDILRERLAREKAIGQVQAKERGVRRALAERLEGELPEAMVGTRAESMMRDFVNNIENRGMTLEQYLELSGLTDEAIAADVTGEAEQGIREDLALEALFRAAGLEITEDDIEQELALMATATNQDKDEARRQWEEMGLMPVIREQIQHRKAVNWLLENATIEIVEPEGAASGDAEGTKTKSPKKGRAKSASKKKDAVEESQTGADDVKVAESFSTETPSEAPTEQPAATAEQADESEE